MHYHDCTWIGKCTWLYENQGLLKVTGSHIHRKRSNISEIMKDGVVVKLVTTDQQFRWPRVTFTVIHLLQTQTFSDVRLYYRAMPCSICCCRLPVCPFACSFVTSQAGIVPTLLNIRPRKQCHTCTIHPLTLEISLGAPKFEVGRLTQIMPR